MTGQRSDFDSPWKEVLEAYFSDFLRFFFPGIHADVDWSRGYEFLDTEQPKVIQDEHSVNKAVKVWQVGTEETEVLVHIVAQTKPDIAFPWTLARNNFRIRDYYKGTVVSLAVLADEDPNWRPNEYCSEVLGTRLLVRFPMVKLLDYQQRWQMLQDRSHPITKIVTEPLKA